MRSVKVKTCLALLESRDEVMPSGQRSLFADQFDVTKGGSSLEANRGPVLPRSPDTRDVQGGKGSVFFRAHAYHTKVPVEGLIRLIEHYTDPGDLVADPFCGSGMTGVASILTGRHAVISDLSPAAVHIARGYTTRVDPVEYAAAADWILSALSDVEELLYAAGQGRIEYRVWSDVYACPDCEREILFWDAGIDKQTNKVITQVSCGNGHGPFSKTNLHWIRSIPVEENVSVPGVRNRRVRPLHSDEQEPFGRDKIGWWYPTAPWEGWREMWRAQHKALGVRTAADFFTNRNLYALAALWDAINRLGDEQIRNAMRFTFTAVVNRASRRYQWHPTRPTNVLSSTMYIAALNYEFNVFSLFRRKVSTISDLYERTWAADGSCSVYKGSATELSWLPDESVDYAFTDPPFGSNIYYADSSFLWEAWLEDFTDVAAEAVVNKRVGSDRGGKDLGGYESLLAKAMSEIGRVLRPKAWTSVQFHNSDDAVWSAVQRSVESAGFHVGAAVVMDKGQASFKGLRHEGKGERVANFDLVMHLHRDADRGGGPRTKVGRTEIAAELIRFMSNAPPSRRTTPWAHSIVMRYLLAEQADLDGWSFAAVEGLCGDLFDREGSRWVVNS